MKNKEKTWEERKAEIEGKSEKRSGLFTVVFGITLLIILAICDICGVI